MTDPWERALRAALAPAREIEPTDAEVQHVLRRHRREAPMGRRVVSRLALAASAVALLAGGTYAVPATRAALGDVYDAISGWFSGDAPPPGRPLTAGDDAPNWIDQAPGEKRLLAENGGARLYAARHGDQLDVALGKSVGISDSISGWRRQFATHKLVFLGPGSFGNRLIDDHFRRPLTGLVARSVTRVELRYTRGAPSAQRDLHGGFVILADARRKPRTFVAFDASGKEVDRLDVSDLELRFCTDVRGCPPGKFTLNAPPQDLR